MKKFIEILTAVKNFTAMVFAGMIMLFVVVGYFFGLSSISFSLIWQAIFIALICGTLHFLAFSDYVVKVKGLLRLVLFAVPLYVVVGAFAVFFRWFPINLGSWVVFTVVFLAGFGVLAGVYHVYFKIAGNKYNQMLDIYQSKQMK
jgi:hypothetical protein